MKLVGSSGSMDVDVPRITDGNANEAVGSFGVGDDYYFYARSGTTVWVRHRAFVARFSLADGHGEDTDHEARAPMTGKVVSIPVKIDDSVKRGDTVAVLEAMKMEYKLEAEADGTVEEIGAKEGDLVDLGQLLVKLK